MTAVAGADGLVARADRLIDLGRYESAEPLLHRALAADAGHVTALTLLSFVYYMVDDYPRSAEVARRLLAANPDSDVPYYRLGEALKFQGRLVEAEQAAREAIRRDPEYPRNLESLADILRLQGGRVSECEELLRKAAELAPDRVAPLDRLARLYRTEHRFADAAAAATEGLARDPLNVDLHLMLGEIRLVQRQPAAAVEAFGTALRIAPAEVDLDRVLNAIVEYGPDPAPSPAGSTPEPGAPAAAQPVTPPSAAEPVTPPSAADDGRPGSAPGPPAGEPEPQLAGLYRTLCVALGRPDLTVPGAAGTDPALRAAQLAVVDSLIDSGRLDRADAILAELRAADPADHGTRRRHAELRYERDECDEALAELRALVADGDDSEATARLSARTVVYTEDHRAAVEIGRDGAARFPHRAVFKIAEAHGLLGLGRAEEARAAAERAVELAPYSVPAQRMLAEVLHKTGGSDDAEAVLHEAVARYPEDPLQWLNLGYHHLMAGKRASAVEAVGRAEELEPENIRVRAWLGVFWLLAGEIDRAAGALSLAVPDCDPDTLAEVVDKLELLGVPSGLADSYAVACAGAGRPVRPPSDPTMLTGMAQFGLTQVHLGRGDSVEPQVRQALTLDPGHPGLLAVLAELRRRQRRWAEAVDLARQSMASEAEPPMDMVGRSVYVWSLIHLHRWADARSAIREALDRFPDEEEFHAARAEALLGAGRDLPDALDAARRAAELAPYDADYRCLAGRVLLRLGDLDCALPDLRRAGQLNPKSAQVACWLGVGSALAGQPDAAARYLADARDTATDEDRAELAEALADTGLAARVPQFADWLGISRGVPSGS